MRSWMLRRCRNDGYSSHNFFWPESGSVEAPDWDPDPKRDCGGGLHGLPEAEGDWWLLTYPKEYQWQIVFYDPSDGMVNSSGKIRIRKGVVETVPSIQLWKRLRELRGHLRFRGSIDFPGADLPKIPPGLNVELDLVLSGRKITTVPKDLIVGQDLDLSCTRVKSIPKSVKVGGMVFLPPAGAWR